MQKSCSCYFLKEYLQLWLWHLFLYYHWQPEQRTSAAICPTVGMAWPMFVWPVSLFVLRVSNLQADLLQQLTTTSQYITRSSDNGLGIPESSTLQAGQQAWWTFKKALGMRGLQVPTTAKDTTASASAVSSVVSTIIHLRPLRGVQE